MTDEATVTAAIDELRASLSAADAVIEAVER